MLIAMTPNTTRLSAAITATKISAARTSIVNAINIAPNTTNGERRNRRSVIFTPVCVWLTSLVRRVIIVDVPSASIFENDSFCKCANSAWRTPVAKPVAAFAEKYCAVIDETSPTAASASRIRHILKMNPLSLF